MSVTVVDLGRILIPLQKKLEKDTIRVPSGLELLPGDRNVRVTGNTIILVMMIAARRAITIKCNGAMVLSCSSVFPNMVNRDSPGRTGSSHRRSSSFERTDRALWIRKIMHRTQR